MGNAMDSQISIYIYIQYIQNFDPYLNTLWLFNSVTVCELEAMAHL